MDAMRKANLTPMIVCTRCVAVPTILLMAGRKGTTAMSGVTPKLMGLAILIKTLWMQVASARALEQDFAPHSNFITTVHGALDVGMM